MSLQATLKLHILAAAAAGGLLGRVSETSAQVLYDGSLGTAPSAQAWSYAAVGIATQTLTNNSVWLDTSLSGATQAGYARSAPVVLNRTNGFTLRFGAQLVLETHNNTDRAGFSVIVLADDKRGIELGFWTNRIFAQSDSPLFTHAEDVAFPTQATVAYSLSLLATNYILRADGVPILSGPIRDYTAFNGFPNPYRTPDFLFLGDDTSSASTLFGLRDVVLIPAPMVSMPEAGMLTWQGVSNATYRVDGTTNFNEWTALGEVTSSTTSFGFTNSADGSFQFFRVTCP
jgi:hypothetical protein